MQREFPDHLELYDWYPRPVLKADLFRLLVVFRLGGFYLDTDFILLKKLDPLCREKAVFAFEHEIDEKNYNFRYPSWLRAGEETLTLANYAFGAEARHPFLAAILDEFGGRKLSKRRTATTSTSSTPPARTSSLRCITAIANGGRM